MSDETRTVKINESELAYLREAEQSLLAFWNVMLRLAQWDERQQRYVMDVRDLPLDSRQRTEFEKFERQIAHSGGRSRLRGPLPPTPTTVEGECK